MTVKIGIAQYGKDIEMNTADNYCVFGFGLDKKDRETITNFLRTITTHPTKKDSELEDGFIVELDEIGEVKSFIEEICNLEYISIPGIQWNTLHCVRDILEKHNERNDS